MNEKSNIGYDVEFVDEVPDLYKCIVCHLVLRDPVMLIQCGHRFCLGCFQSLKKHAEDRNIDLLCPHDRAKVKDDQVC